MLSEPTVQITLRPDVREELERNAEQADKSIDDLINEAIEEYFYARQIEKLNNEIAAYEQMHGDLWQQFAGQWVAIHHQKLVDHDADDVALYRRVRARYGRTSVLIRRVGKTPVDEIWMRTYSTGRIDS